jgi:AraC-like DNA-binding protein
MGPMLYWYVRSVLSDHAGMKRPDLLHVIPMIIFFAASLPFAFVPLSEKVETATQFANNAGIMQTYAATFLSKIFPIEAIYLSRPVLLLAYNIWSMVLMTKYFLRNKHKQVFRRQKFMIKWVVLLLVLVLFLVTSHIILIIHTFKMHFSDIATGLKMVRMVSAFGLIGLMISPLLFPTILYGLPRIPEKHKQKPKKTGKINLENIKKIPDQNDHGYQYDIGQRMDKYMKEYQPYLQPHFNMNHLAVQLDIPVHHIAYYFREEKKQTFSEYRNHWRIEHAKKLFTEGKNSELTLEAIASLSGFSNRNSFSTIFQKSEGVCPSTFAGQYKET